MASIKPVANGYRAQVYVNKKRDSKCFRTQREAKAWASVREIELRRDKGGTKHTLGEAFTRYANEVSITKRGSRWERIRIAAIMGISLIDLDDDITALAQADARAPMLPIDLYINEITPDIIGKWRDDRLKVVGNGTVLREIGLLSAIFEEARREWRWIDSNPVKDVRKPRQPDHRDTLLTRPQIKAMLRSLGYSPLLPIRSVSQAIAVAFLVAMRSGMRAGEMCGLTWARVYDGYCQTPHKTGNTALSMRDVPLTPKALRLINKMRGFDPVKVFGLDAPTLDTLFRRARVRAGLSGFVFHDTRHTAATWMAQKIHVLDLCRAFGWSNTSRALTYYSPKASDIAKRAT